MMRSKTSIPMQPNRVLAIDPGFDRIGVAVMEAQGSKHIVLHSECITTKPKDRKEFRLLSVGQRIRKLIEEWQPQDLAIETLFFNTNVSSAIGVAEARGIIIYEATSGNLEVNEYSPQAIKIAVTSYGRATKADIQKMIPKLVSLKEIKRLDDELDAIAVGITHLASKKDICYK